MRRVLSLTAVVSVLALTANVVLAAPREVRTTGDERVVPNAMVQATLRFTPGMVGIASGEDATFTHDDNQAAPHTATIVEEFPAATLEAIFGCGAPGQPCALALAAHGVSGPIVDVGAPGFNEPGDSLLFFEDGSISAEVTAAPGTTLKYLCAIHPWMQGEIQVR